MKKNLRLLTGIFAFTLLLINGCKKDDTTSPVVTLNGDANIEISLNSTFTDPGATATDDEDGAIPATPSGTVDVNQTGTYTINYIATDAAGNSGSATRTVTVVNDADDFAGIYDNSVDSCNISGISQISATVVASDSINRMVKIQNFGGFGNSITVYAVITDNAAGAPITIATNQSLGTVAFISNVYSAQTIVLNATSPTSFRVHYQWDDGSNQETCVTDYIR
jgi:hypothetical protein